MNIREVISRLNPYEGWKATREVAPQSALFRHSVGVFELPNGVIKKLYDITSSTHREWFSFERRALDYLTRMGSLITPKLLYVDEEKATLYMANCGTPPEPTAVSIVVQAQTAEVVAEAKRVTTEKARVAKERAKEVDRAMRELELKYGVSYLLNAGKKQYTYPPHQTVWRKGRVTLVDFHDPKLWHINPPEHKHSPIQDNNPIRPIPQISKPPIPNNTPQPSDAIQ